MPPEIDVVMALHATREYPAETYFAKCYEDLCKTVKDFRLILVADACDNQAWQTVDFIAKDRRNTLLIRSNFQRWFTRAYNLGFRMVRTPRVVALNVDTVLADGWLDELKMVWAEAESHGTRVGLVGSVYSAPEPRRWAFSVRPDYCTGHAWLISMQALYEASVSRGQPGWYLDETNWQNIHIRSDVELSWRLNELGWGVVKSFKSAVGHHGGKSWGHNLVVVQCLKLEDVSD